MRRYVFNGQEIHYWYGIAWHDFDRDVGVAYPLPFNIIFRLTRDFRFWLMSVGRPGYREGVERECYRQGSDTCAALYERALEREYLRGKQDGWAEYHDTVRREIEAYRNGEVA